MLKLLEVLFNYFPTERDRYKRYNLLVSLLYDIGSITGLDVDEIIEKLDEHFTEENKMYIDGYITADKSMIDKSIRELKEEGYIATPITYVQTQADSEGDRFSDYNRAIDYCKSVVHKGGIIYKLNVEFYCKGNSVILKVYEPSSTKDILNRGEF